MWLKKKPSELRVIIVLLLIVALISITGISSYLKLSAIAKNVSTTVNTDNRISIVLRSIIVDLEDSWNNVRSYNLTNDDQYAFSFYTSVVTIEKKFYSISEGRKHFSKEEQQHINRTVALTEKCLSLLKSQLYRDEKNITEELDAISLKIDEAYASPKNQATVGISSQPELPDKKESIFNRIFKTKNKRLRPSVTPNETDSSSLLKESNTINASKLKGDLQSAVKHVKIKQQDKLAYQKNSELRLSSEVKNLMTQLRDITSQMELLEEKNDLKNIQAAKRDVDTIRTLAIIISSIITILLLLVIVLIIKYVRKKKEYEEALIHAKQHAEELAKTKEAFLANMSHEIKTPLNAIFGFTEQVLKGKLETEQYEQLNIVKESSEHLIRLISDILDYSKIQSGKIKIEYVNFNLKRELENIHTLFVHQSANRNLELIFRTQNEIPGNINASLTKLKQVMYNLIGNAIKFTEKGTVTVTVAIEKSDEQNFLSIHVKDTGIGIPKNKIPKLFNEYEQLHSDAYNKFGGTGLGLVITKKLLEQMGGSIQVTSEEGKGTEVAILFPYYPASELNAGDKNTISENELANLLKGKRILIVDDEQFNRLLLKAILGKFETEIVEAVNGNEAVAFVKSQQFDLVIMDLRMPEKTGTEACKEIRRFNKSVYILASTALLGQQQAAECEQMGFNGVVTKPFTEKNLLNTIYSFLDKSPNQESPQQSKLNLSELTSLANGDETFKKDMIKLFHTSINNALQNILEYSKHQKWTEISEAAHKVLPSCKHFEANALYTHFKFFENLKTSIPVYEEVQKKLQQLEKEVEEINIELRVYL
ncbi:MAG: hypothetical protein K0R26_311 [Bacteroidota bacterium]|jgi:signal transduction histidine kinase/DNA-binding response OmpR family regulator|nr:hypothetical protein [Bacteroidota bacterium]